MPIIQAPLQPRPTPASPLVNPNAFGDSGLGAVSDALSLVAQQAEQRNEQRQAIDLATLRATVTTQAADFLQGLEQNETDFAAMPTAWVDEQARLDGIIAGYDPVVQEAFEADRIRIYGTTSRGVSSLAHARESDHFIAAADRSIADIISLAPRGGVDHDHNQEMINTIYLELFRSNYIDEVAATNGIQADTREYINNMHYGAISADPQGWYAAHTGEGVDRSQETQAIVASAAAAAGVAAPRVVSGHRTQEQQDQLRAAYDAAVARGENPEPVAEVSQHTSGGAVDYAYPRNPDGTIDGDALAALMDQLISQGFTGFGFYSTGHFHVDRDNDTVRVWGDQYMPPQVAALFEARGVADGAQRQGPAPEPASISGRSRLPLDGLSPSESDSLFNYAEREINRMAESARNDIVDAIAGYDAALSAGVAFTGELPTAEEIRAAWPFDPDRAQEVIDQQNNLTSLAAISEQMHARTNEELDAWYGNFVQRYRAGEGGSVTTAEDVAVLTTISRWYQDITEARQDPGQYALDRSPALAEQLATAETPAERADAQNAVIAAQTFTQTPRLPDNYVSGLVATYDSIESPSDRLAFIGGVTTLDDDTARERLFAQMEVSGLDTGVRSILEARLDDRIKADMLAVLADWPAIEERLKQRFPNEEDRNNAIIEVRAAYDSEWGAIYDQAHAITANPEILREITREREVVTRLAIARALNEGTGEPSLSGVGADVTEELFGHRQEVTDTSFTVPPVGMEEFGQSGVRSRRFADLVETGMDFVLDNLPSMIPVERLEVISGLPGGSPEMDEIRRDNYAMLIDGAEWVNVDHNRYGIAMAGTGYGGRLLSDENGDPFTWTAAELLNIVWGMSPEERRARLGAEPLPLSIDRILAITGQGQPIPPATPLRTMPLVRPDIAPLPQRPGTIPPGRSPDEFFGADMPVGVETAPPEPSGANVVPHVPVRIAPERL